MIEQGLYIFIEILLIVLFIASIYDVIMLHVYEHNDKILRAILNICISSVLIFFGLFVSVKMWKNTKITEIQKSFIKHCCPFLIVTGITMIIISSKYLEDTI